MTWYAVDSKNATVPSIYADKAAASDAARDWAKMNPGETVHVYELVPVCAYRMPIEPAFIVMLVPPKPGAPIPGEAP